MRAEVREGQLIGNALDVDLPDAEGPRSGGERSEPERRGPSGKTAGLRTVKEAERPDPEVPAKAQRRKYSAEYKQRILQEADACKDTGTIGALLRREGLYASHLTTWRRQREKGQLNGLAPKKRGKKNKPVNPLSQKIKDLESENRRLQKQLEKAETIIEFQKKLSEMLGISMTSEQDDGKC